MERDRYSPVISVHDHVDCREVPERVRAVGEYVIGYDSVPERIIRGSAEDAAPRGRSEVEVIEGKLRRVPHQVENPSAEVCCGRPMGGRGGGVTGGVVHACQGSVCVIW